MKPCVSRRVVLFILILKDVRVSGSQLNDEGNSLMLFFKSFLFDELNIDLHLLFFFFNDVLTRGGERSGERKREREVERERWTLPSHKTENIAFIWSYGREKIYILNFESHPRRKIGRELCLATIKEFKAIKILISLRNSIKYFFRVGLDKWPTSVKAIFIVFVSVLTTISCKSLFVLWTLDKLSRSVKKTKSN